MQKFTDVTRKELAEYLNSRYSAMNGSVSDIVDIIREWAEDHDIENDIQVDAQFCRREEVTDGFWEYIGVDGILEIEYDKTYYVIDITTEGGGICIYATYPDEDDPFL